MLCHSLRPLLYHHRVLVNATSRIPFLLQICLLFLCAFSIACFQCLNVESEEKSIIDSCDPKLTILYYESILYLYFFHFLAHEINPYLIFPMSLLICRIFTYTCLLL
nr:hypothetical transcript [Hymenolepis microstoma]